MLVTATDLDMTADAISLCTQVEDLACTAGIHPHDARNAPDDLGDRLQDLAASAEVRAIGETGLDFNRNFSPPEAQKRVFDAQLTAAGALGLPVFVHDRDTDGAVYRALKLHGHRLPAMVVHCFTGSQADLDRYLAIGCLIGITGWICDRRRGQALRDLVGRIPLERLMIETDAPFLLPQNAPRHWHREHAPGVSRRRNEPALLRYVAEGIAEASGVPVSEIVDATSRNAAAVFNLS